MSSVASQALGSEASQCACSRMDLQNEGNKQGGRDQTFRSLLQLRAPREFEAFYNAGSPCEDLDIEIFGRKTCNHLMRLADNKTVLYELSYVLPRVRHGYFAYLRGKGFFDQKP